MPDHLIAFLVLGAAAGILSGMFGIGGGVVIVPALVVLFGFGLKEGLGTSLAALVWPVGIFAVLAYYRAGQLQLRAATLIALGLVGGNVLGAQLALGLPGDTLQRIYGLFLFFMGWRFVEPRKLLTQRRNGAPPAADPVPVEVAWYILLVVGVGAGIASGLFGIGGGLVIVPALVVLLRYDQKRAVGTSLVAQLPPVGIGGVLSYYDAGELALTASLVIALGLLAGSLAGARIALGLPSATVKRLYGVFLLVISLRFIFQL
ncbi:MAG: sulfite exporter TauE/SafE family protein [Chloroflexi bacterium]|nr:sulfite exporter TauE/SafE family protein [Chloroflexota bacterium]